MPCCVVVFCDCRGIIAHFREIKRYFASRNIALIASELARDVALSRLDCRGILCKSTTRTRIAATTRKTTATVFALAPTTATKTLDP